MVTDPGAPRVLIVVPAYNEERSLARVLAAIKEKAPAYDVLVVNDGSGDGTSRAARAGGASVVDLSFNLGIGGAVQTGFKHALRQGYAVVVQVDGDGQHPPEEIQKLVEPVLRDAYDVVIGSRFLEPTDYRGSRRRRLMIALLSWLCSRFAGGKITDCTSGFRAFSQPAVAFLADNYDMEYPEPKCIPALARQGMRIKEVSVNMRERASGISSLSGLKALSYVINVTLALLVDSIRTRPSQRVGEDEP